MGSWEKERNQWRELAPSGRARGKSLRGLPKKQLMWICMCLWLLKRSNTFFDHANACLVNAIVFDTLQPRFMFFWEQQIVKAPSSTWLIDICVPTCLLSSPCSQPFISKITLLVWQQICRGNVNSSVLNVTTAISFKRMCNVAVYMLHMLPPLPIIFA